jgi:hypothetical protein
MRLEIVAILITAFFVYNTYHDGKYTKMLLSFKKYYKMIFYVTVGISLYLLMKRSPDKGHRLLFYANNMIKHLPIDKKSMDMMSPIFDVTTNQNDRFMCGLNGVNSTTPYENRILASGKQPTNSKKRSVSETKKKFVASKQNWCCGNCSKQLNAWFEVDHKLRLEHGGSNEVNNLVALCRECHGEKTAMENL